MIARLKGTLVEKSPSRILLDVGGVGYDVLVPLSTYYGLGEPGSALTLRVHTHVREDAIALFGFFVWEHHMFIMGISTYSALVFSLMTMLVAVPSAIKIFNWSTTLYKGSISFDTP